MLYNMRYTKRRLRTLLPAALLLPLLVACASVGPNGVRTRYDPIEPVNRVTFQINSAVDKVTIKPALFVYRTIIPRPIRRGLGNLSSNLATPVTAANQLLQGHPKAMLRSLARLLINSTLGIGGLFDPAKRAGILPVTEDFGQTLGVWGIGQGPYVVLPLLGPSSLRDTFGKAVDVVSDPLFWLLRGANNEIIRNANTRRAVSNLQSGLGFVTETDAFYDELEELQKTVDPYVALRESWRQSREADVRNGVPPMNPADDPLGDVLDAPVAPAPLPAPDPVPPQLQR